ncbi:MAG TPA: DUF4383 domain-containing protein [Longimicrobium sp.]|jgi:hypothetical protein|uniref:DUF4383 domain-containing protein n=1 Tax=Longimicrobium sp. TaxID=2029185 RepID=UPI002ED8F589
MRTTTQKAAMVFGVVFLLVGLLGLFIPRGMGMESDSDTAPKLLGLFPVNLLHNLVHLGFGVWGLAASRSHGAARGYHRAGAIIYLVLVVLAFVDDTTFGLVPIGGNDIWLHALLAAGLGYFGFVHREAGVPARS